MRHINGAAYPLERFIGRICLSGKLAGGDEPWRKWMQSTGWTGLSKPMKNPYTGEEICQNTSVVNRWIGENGNWDKDMDA